MNIISTSQGFVMCFWERKKMLELAEQLLNYADEFEKDQKAPVCLGFFHPDLSDERRREILNFVKRSATR